MSELFIVLLVINIIGIVVCNKVAKARGSKHVIFWTIMGIIFGPLVIPFVLRVPEEGERRTADGGR